MEKDIYYLVGQNIKKQRKIKGLTQLQLANKTFFSYEFIRKIESKSACRNTFSLDILSKIAQALEIDIRLLFAPLEDGDTSNNTQKWHKKFYHKNRKNGCFFRFFVLQYMCI